MCHSKGCRQKFTRLHAISRTKTEWSSLTHNRVLHQALARFLRKSNAQFVVEDTRPFREKASGQHGKSNPLRTDLTAEVKALSDNHPQRKNKALIFDIIIVNPFVTSNMKNAARHIGKHHADAVKRKKNKYRGSFLATYSLLPFAISTCGEAGPDVHALIRELAIRRVEHRSEIHSNESRHLAEGTKVARLQRIYLVLQQALSFRTRSCGHPTAAFARSSDVHCTAEGTRTVRREGANGDGDGDGDGAGTGTGTETREKRKSEPGTRMERREERSEIRHIRKEAEWKIRHCQFAHGILSVGMKWRLQVDSNFGRKTWRLFHDVVQSGEPGPRDGREETVTKTGTGAGTGTRTGTGTRARIGTETGTGTEIRMETRAERGVEKRERVREPTK